MVDTTLKQRHAEIDELVERALIRRKGKPAGVVELAQLTGVQMMAVSWSLKRLERRAVVMGGVLRGRSTNGRSCETIATYIAAQFVGLGQTRMPAWLAPRALPKPASSRVVVGRCGLIAGEMDQ